MRSPDTNKMLTHNTFGSEYLVFYWLGGRSTSITCKSESFILPDRSQMDSFFQTGQHFMSLLLKTGNTRTTKSTVSSLSSEPTLGWDSYSWKGLRHSYNNGRCRRPMDRTWTPSSFHWGRRCGSILDFQWVMLTTFALSTKKPQFASSAETRWQVILFNFPIDWRCYCYIMMF